MPRNVHSHNPRKSEAFVLGWSLVGRASLLLGWLDEFLAVLLFLYKIILTDYFSLILMQTLGPDSYSFFLALCK